MPRERAPGSALLAPARARLQLGSSLRFPLCRELAGPPCPSSATCLGTVFCTLADVAPALARRPCLLAQSTCCGLAKTPAAHVISLAGRAPFLLLHPACSPTRALLPRRGFPACPSSPSLGKSWTAPLPAQAHPCVRPWTCSPSHPPLCTLGRSCCRLLWMLSSLALALCRPFIISASHVYDIVDR